MTSREYRLFINFKRIKDYIGETDLHHFAHGASDYGVCSGTTSLLNSDKLKHKDADISRHDDILKN
jgi:hypothetical protein